MTCCATSPSGRWKDNSPSPSSAVWKSWSSPSCRSNTAPDQAASSPGTQPLAALGFARGPLKASLSEHRESGIICGPDRREPRYPRSCARGKVPMKVLLVSPPLNDLYYAARVIIPPLGILYIGGKLEADGHNVEIRDMSFYHGPETYDGYDLVGITCTTPQYGEALDYARKAHEAGCRTLLGGTHVTFTTQTTLRLPYVDFVIRG